MTCQAARSDKNRLLEFCNAVVDKNNKIEVADNLLVSAFKANIGTFDVSGGYWGSQEKLNSPAVHNFISANQTSYQDIRTVKVEYGQPGKLTRTHQKVASGDIFDDLQNAFHTYLSSIWEGRKDDCIIADSYDAARLKRNSAYKKHSANWEDTRSNNVQVAQRFAMEMAKLFFDGIDKVLGADRTGLFRSLQNYCSDKIVKRYDKSKNKFENSSIYEFSDNPDLKRALGFIPQGKGLAIHLVV